MSKKLYFFIDESGDPHFYAKGKRPLWTEPTFEPILMLGMISVEDRRALHQKILDFQNQILADPLYNTIPSVMKPNWFLHACKDHAEVRIKFFEFLRAQEDIKCYVVVGRKILDIFHNKHNSNPTEFYFDLVNKLLALFEYVDGEEHLLFLSGRQSNTTERFVNALEKALEKQSKKFTDTHFKCRVVPSKDYPELSVVDYFLWTLKRYFTTNERRYFTALEDKFEAIYDVYENEGKGKLYRKGDIFDISKASSFEIK
jgi:Protein of unknown function (DUF3800)